MSDLPLGDPAALLAELKRWGLHGLSDDMFVARLDRFGKEYAARTAPQTGPMNLRERSNTESHPNTVAGAPGEAGRG